MGFSTLGTAKQKKPGKTLRKQKKQLLRVAPYGIGKNHMVYGKKPIESLWYRKNTHGIFVMKSSGCFWQTISFPAFQLEVDRWCGDLWICLAWRWSFVGYLVGNKRCGSGGNSKIFGICTPKIWRNDPIWRAYFSDGWFNHQPEVSCQRRQTLREW